MSDTTISFSVFVSSLAATALMSMGLGQAPDGQGPPTDMSLAREFIDTLDMLQRKTAGNLDEEEAALLQHLLTDLRLQFVNQTERTRG